MSTEREVLRLQDIVENIDKIELYLAGFDYAAFAADGKTIDAVERCLQRITEAAIKIGPERMAEISPRTPVDAVRGLGTSCGTIMTDWTSKRFGERRAKVCPICAKIVCARSPDAR